MSHRDDARDGLTAVLLLVLLGSVLLMPIAPVMDVVTAVFAGLGLAWLAYARYGA